MPADNKPIDAARKMLDEMISNALKADAPMPKTMGYKTAIPVQKVRLRVK